MLMFVASTPLLLNNSWAAEDTVYVEFTPTGNESINAYGYNDFGTVYAGQTVNCPTTTYTAENNGTSSLSTVTVECTANSGALTAVDAGPGADQFAIQVKDESGDLATFQGIADTAQTIESDLTASATETFGIQINLGTLTEGTPGAENCTLTVTGTD